MTNSVDSKMVFDDLVSRAAATLTVDDLSILKAHEKDRASRMLHLTAGHQLRDALGLWGEGASEKLLAIEQHANQGMLLGFDADGASSAMLGFLWDRFHCQK